jgi:WD40 repeat protein
VDRPEKVLLRSWRLPDGEKEVLGRIDRAAEGISWIVFDPQGRGWLYARGPSVVFRPRPPLTGGDRVLARHPSDVVLVPVPNTPDQAYSRDTSGEIRVWRFTSTGPELAKIIHRPATAPPVVFPDPTGRWLMNRVRADRQARLWDLRAWPAGRPLILPWGGSSEWAQFQFHPRSEWVVVSPDQIHLLFWPLGTVRPTVVDGLTTLYSSLTFSADGRWLVANWTNDTVRLWPLPGSGATRAPLLDLPKGLWLDFPALDPKVRYLFLTGNETAPGAASRAFVVPFDGSPRRELGALPADTGTLARAISPSGRLAATAFWFGFAPHRRNDKLLRVWDLEAVGWRDFVLPVPSPSAGTEHPLPAPTGFEGSILSLAFVDETTIVTAGHGGIRRWNLETGAHELVLASEPGRSMTMALSGDGRTALTAERPFNVGGAAACGHVALLNLATHRSQPLEGFGECGVSVALDPTGTVAAIADREGVVRVWRVPGGEPHLLLGHERLVKSIAISPDLRWIATVGEDRTLRLWPMPDLAKAPLHTLPHDELLAKLKSLTNLRVVRDTGSSSGWKVEVGPFPGWKDVPTW